GFGYLEGCGDLGGGQSADGAQCQCDLGGGGQGRVAAAEQQEQGVIALFRCGGLGLLVNDPLAAVAGGLAAAGIDDPVLGRAHQPGVPVARRVLGPGAHGIQQCFLESIVGGGEVLPAPDERGQGAWDEKAQ